LLPCVTGTVADRSRASPLAEARLSDWFAERGWRPFAFQRRVWRAAASGSSGLLHAGTGSGKTLAVWFGALLRTLKGRAGPPEHGLKVLWVTPMRALAADTVRALETPLAGLGLACSVGLRTGDTPSAERARQDRKPPFALVTTPESLSLMISRADAAARLGGVEVVIVDEWHELMGAKRGVQLQLALARIVTLAGSPPVVWGVSATLGNPGEALDVLLGGRPGVLVEAAQRRLPVIDTLLPDTLERFPWAGHLGARMLGAVVDELAASASSLVFCNTRAQAELWYAMILDARPDWAGAIALHHGSLDVEVRRWVERAIGDGRLRAVVCTSSLDLGVDFAPVERVLQIGSAKGVGRLLQRAGRSGHRPGAVSRVTLVPTHALELIEGVAARDAVRAGRIEARLAPACPVDVLVQHLVTVGVGTGFVEAEMLAEVRSTHAYRALDDEAWRWSLGFVSEGASLSAYPEYRKLVRGDEGRWRVADATIARRHRMSIGTIVADAAIELRFMNGARLGTVEEAFVARLRPGDRFMFGGRVLELVRVHEMSAWVRRASATSGAVPRWSGGRMPLSGKLAHAVLERLRAAATGVFTGPEMRAVRPLLELQARWSRLPEPSILLAETLVSREGHHLFAYPFAGRHANLGLACLLAWRASRGRPATISVAVNDYGFELLSEEPLAAAQLASDSGLVVSSPAEDLSAAVNAAELSRRRFREIARVAGLVFQGHPRERRSARSLQASATMFHEVFDRHDPGNLLLAQSRQEVLAHELELGRIEAALAGMRARSLVMVPIARPTPFAFPLMVERLRETVSTETLADRVARMVAELEAAAQC